MLRWLTLFIVEHTETMHCYSLPIFSEDTTYKAVSVLQFHVLQFYALQLGPSISCPSFSAPPSAPLSTSSQQLLAAR